jgi:O-antigen ligase
MKVSKGFAIGPHVWVAVWGVLVSLAWLIPNHFPPWAGFHADAWIASVALLAAVFICKNNKNNIEWHGIPVLVLVLVFIPWIQYFFKILPFASQAWLSSAYLFGFLLALLIGARWERIFPVQLVDALFGAVTLAAIASVGLALGSWVDVIDTNVDSFLSMGYYGGRHYANLGQPNLLAALILWGVIGCLWAYVRKTVSPIVVLVACMYLVLGLTLTRSRMAYAASFLLLTAVWVFRRFWKSAWLPWSALFVFIFYILSPCILSFVDENILLSVQDAQYIRSVGQGELRISAWKLFLNASLQRPWFGYGLTEVVGAQIEVAQNYPSLGGMFGHAHNIFVDLIVWIGIPVGGAVCACGIYWFWQSAIAIKSQEDVVIFMALIVMAIHSMLEYPLQYAYFLIPTGMLVGVLNVRLGGRVLFCSPRWVLAVFLLCATLLLGQIIRDYLNIQNSYNVWRFERASIIYPIKNATKIPKVQLLTQFRYWFEMVGTQPFKGMTFPELALREQVTRTYPSPGAIFELAIAYGKNDQAANAQLWLGKVCRLSSVQECASFRNAWTLLQKSDADLAGIAWLEESPE